MTLHETQQLLTILKVSYPNAYRSMSKEDAEATVLHYHSFFGEYETPIVVQALRNYIKKNQYPPTVAGLIEQINLLTETDTDSELWNLIAKACRNGYYNSSTEFNKLPKECQLFVGSPESLREMSQIESSTFSTVTKGQFLKTIVQIRKREEAQKGLPEEFKKMLENKAKLIE